MRNKKRELLVLGTVFIATGIGVSLSGVMTIMNGRTSSSWPSVKGTIIASGVSSERKRETTTQRAYISSDAALIYQYQVNGRAYSSGKIRIGDFAFRSGSRAKEIVSKYPEGKKVIVYYNPKNPEITVLEPGMPRGSLLFVGVGLLCVFGGLGAMRSAFRQQVKDQ
jgi:cell division protein YceG involved in septum cleavage